MNMRTIGIITIHKVNNYGSVLQAYALQRVLEDVGFKVEIIDYDFPNAYHDNNQYKSVDDTKVNEPKWIKMLYALSILLQHRGIRLFVQKYHHLSKNRYSNPDSLICNPPHYDIYITGSDQVWNPRFCNGDPAFMLHFAPDSAKKISYASSIGASNIPDSLLVTYQHYLSRYHSIAVREHTSVETIHRLLGKEPVVVLDPTLLLDKNQWNAIASSKKLIKSRYILCYFLNYTFNAFPYVDELTTDLQRQTGYEVVWVARPPHKMHLRHIHYKVGASPEEFLALIRDAEMVLTTSFHGTAFALNYGKPLFTIVSEYETSDSRQVSLMRSLGLEKQILTVKDAYPEAFRAYYDMENTQRLMNQLRFSSMSYLKSSVNG